MNSGDDPDDSYKTTIEYLCKEETPVSIAILQALCAIEDVDTVDASEELGITLYDYIDPEALDRLVTDGSGDEDVVVEFEIEGYDVSVTGSGRIFVGLQ